MSPPPTDTRDRLLDAVAVVLRRDGLGGFSLRRVATEAGVSHGAPGALFGDFSGMLTAFAARGFERLDEMIAAAVVGAPDAREELAAVGRAYVAFALEEPERFSVMFRGELLRSDDPALLAARDRSYQRLQTALERAVGEGRLEASRLPLVALGAWSIVHGLASLIHSGHLPRRMGAVDGHALADAVASMYAGLTLRPPDSGA